MIPILEASKNHPQQVAFDDGDTQITYRDLPTILKQTAIMGQSEIRFGQHIAWSPQNDLDAFLTFWAILSRGCIACPISFRLSEKQRFEVLKKTDSDWLPDLIQRTNQDSTGNNARFEHDQTKASTIILSSGSSGSPKAVVHSLSAHVANAMGAAVNMPLVTNDRWLWSLPLFHVSGLSILVRCAISGATVVGLQPERKLSGQLLRDQQITHLSVVAPQLQRLLEDQHFPSSSLKFVLLGGSLWDSRLVTRAREQGVRVLTTYGLSEMASQVTTSDRNGDPSKSGKILAGRELKIDQHGQIHVRGETLCRGYYEDGDIRSVTDGDGWFATKDLGILDQNGELTVLGRMDNMFVSGGENIYPENIERVLLSLFDIKQVVVVPRPDETFGHRPVAVIQGELPSDWKIVLRTELSGFELPEEILPWPENYVSTFKLDRMFFQKIVRDNLC